jgi:hypothetical protein
MAVTYRRRKQAVPYRTRLTGRLISCNEGFDADRIGPLTNLKGVIPGLAEREPEIHWAAESVEKWIPGSCCARRGMTAID